MNHSTVELAILLWQEYKFKLMLLETPGQGFEDLFTRVMRLSKPEHFHISRGGGSKGDHSCDGWDSSSKTLYSVYAPFSKKDKRRIAAKLEGDLKGAMKNYPEMQRWRLVHNDLFGMHAEITRALADLRGNREFSNIEILADLDPQELWEELERLPADKRRSFLKGPYWEVFPDSDDWSEIGVRFHEDVPDASVRSALRSLVQLCNNFDADSTLDLASAIAVVGTTVVWWLNDENLFKDYLHLLEERSESSPMETQITALALLLRCVEICAGRLKMTKECLIESQCADGNLGPLHVIMEIVRDEFNGNTMGIRVDDAATRFKFIQGCLQAVTHFVGMTSASGYPALFALQDLIISMQRIDYIDGIYRP